MTICNKGPFVRDCGFPGNNSDKIIAQNVFIYRLAMNKT